MKKLCLISIIPLAILHADDMTLDECVKLSLQNSKKIEAVRADVDVAHAMKKEALSNLLPHVQLEGRYEWKNSDRDYSVFTDFGSAFSTQTLNVTANMLLFDFFSAWNFYRAGQYGVVASESNLEKALLLLTEEVKNSYFRVLETQKAIVVVEDSIRSLQQQLQTVNDYYSQGIISKADVLSVEVLLAEKKKAHLRSINDHVEAKMALNRLLGRELYEPVFLQELGDDPYPVPSVDVLQKIALTSRNDRKSLQAQISALDARYKATKSLHAPKFFLFGGYTFLENSPPPGGHASPDKNWLSGGIGMRLPLYEGGRDASQIDKTRAQMHQAQAQLEDLDTWVALEVERSYLSLQEQFANISIEETAIALAEENLRSVTDRYTQGLVSINDVLKAYEQLSQSKMNKNRAIYRYHSAYARLATVVGGKI